MQRESSSSSLSAVVDVGEQLSEPRAWPTEQASPTQAFITAAGIRRLEFIDHPNVAVEAVNITTSSAVLFGRIPSQHHLITLPMGDLTILPERKTSGETMSASFTNQAAGSLQVRRPSGRPVAQNDRRLSGSTAVSLSSSVNSDRMSQRTSGIQSVRS